MSVRELEEFSRSANATMQAESLSETRGGV